MPVDAPEGTEAEAVMPLFKVILTMTVGLPRESRISSAVIFCIFVIINFRIKSLCSALLRRCHAAIFEALDFFQRQQAAAHHWIENGKEGLYLFLAVHDLNDQWQVQGQ